MYSVLAAAAAAVFLFSPWMIAADGITDSDERFRIKYGRYPAHVEQSRNRMADMFGKLDRDGDGRISRTEWKKHSRCSCSFTDRDENADGDITRAEWTASE